MLNQCILVGKVIKINKETGAAVIMASHNYHVIEKYPARLLRVAGGDVIEEEEILMP